MKMFMTMIDDLYFDRDDGYRTSSLNLTDSTASYDLNLFESMQNREKQVNLICFLESQREPDPKLRSDIYTIKKLFSIGKIFKMLGYKVVILGSQLFTDENNNACWRHIPHELNDECEELLTVYPTNTINVYLDVDFNAQSFYLLKVDTIVANPYRGKDLNAIRKEHRAETHVVNFGINYNKNIMTSFFAYAMGGGSIKDLYDQYVNSKNKYLKLQKS